MNLAAIIDEHARTRPEAPFYLKGDARMTYGELAAAVPHIARRLGDEGVRAGDLVGVSIRSHELLLAGVLALASLGACAVPMAPASAPSRRRAVAQHFRMAAMLGGDDTDETEGVRTIRAQEAWLRPGAPVAPLERHPGGEVPWCITLTSGTTGTPKGVARTHAGFYRLSALQAAVSGLDRNSRFLILMDLHTTGVLMRALNHLACGGAVVAPGGGEVPVDRHQVTHCFASPAAMQTWLKARPRSRPPLATMKQLVVGGDRIPEPLSRAITERITPNLYQSYGTTETGIVALADPQTMAQHPDAAGRFLHWVEAQVVDEEDNPLPEGRSGILRLRGEGVAQSYYRIDPDDPGSQRGFRGGWCYPGDMARIGPGRLLYVEGRFDDIVTLGGPKINVTAIEALLASHPGVREVSVFGTSGSLTGKPLLVAAVVAKSSLRLPDLLNYYRDQGGQHGNVLRFVQVAELPRNDMGKVAKHELRKSIRSKLNRSR